jgi:hypothetical protein
VLAGLLEVCALTPTYNTLMANIMIGSPTEGVLLSSLYTWAALPDPANLIKPNCHNSDRKRMSILRKTPPTVQRC